jgi:hypothetical protein
MALYHGHLTTSSAEDVGMHKALRVYVSIDAVLRANTDSLPPQPCYNQLTPERQGQCRLKHDDSY